MSATTAETARKNACQTLSTVDLTSAYGFEKTLENNPTLMQQFVADPVTVIQQQTGVQLPAGFHCHYVDASNSYSPSEGSATDQIAGQDSSGTAWTRVEVRTSSGASPSCIAFCLICLSTG